MFSVKNHTNHAITIDDTVIPAYAEYPFTKFVDKKNVNRLLNNHTITIIVKNDVPKPIIVPKNKEVVEPEVSIENERASHSKPRSGKRKSVEPTTDISIIDKMEGDMNDAAD